MRRLRTDYDWVVLGDHPGALLSAAIVARLGLSVLVLPGKESAQVRVSRSGQCFEPESNFLLGFGKTQRVNGLLWDTLGRAGATSTERQRIVQHESSLQVLTPKHRLNLISDDDGLAREVRREFGGEGLAESGIVSAMERSEELILGYWRDYSDRFSLDPAKLQKVKAFPHARTSLEGIRKVLAQGGNLRPATERPWYSSKVWTHSWSQSLSHSGWSELLAGSWTGLSQSRFEETTLPEMLQLLALARTGASFRGGLGKYRTYLLQLAKRLGAHVVESGQTKRIFVEEGRFVGIQAANSGTMIGARGGALGVSLDVAEDWVSGGSMTWRKRLKKALPFSGWKFTLALTVNEEAIPPGMGSNLVWQEAGAPALEIEIAPIEDYLPNESGKKLIFLRTVLQSEPQSFLPGYQRMVAARMFRQLSELVPFLEYHVVRVYPDFRSEHEEFQEAYPFSSLRDIPENLRFQSPQGVGVFSGVDGLFVLTGEAYPHLGSLGPTAAAIESSAWVAHRNGLSGPFV